MYSSYTLKKYKLKEILDSTHDFKYVNIARNIDYYTEKEIDKMYLILGLKLNEKKELKKMLREIDRSV